MNLLYRFSYLFHARHVPNMEADQWVVDRAESDILHHIRLDPVGSLVGRVIQFDDGFYGKIWPAYNEIHMLLIDFVELCLPFRIVLLCDSDQGLHSYLRKDHSFWQCFHQSDEQRLFWFGQRRFWDVGRNASAMAASASRSKFSNYGNCQECNCQQKSKGNQALHINPAIR